MAGSVLIQAGHVGRKRGATGTRGAVITEQQATERLAAGVVWLLGLNGVHVDYVPADPRPWPSRTYDAFVALHFDGSTNPAARGASFGYPRRTAAASQALAQSIWSGLVFAGHPSGRRPDNYTGARMSSYYGWAPGRARARALLLLEGGFLTNPAEERWIVDNLENGRLPLAVAAGILHHLRGGA